MGKSFLNISIINIFARKSNQGIFWLQIVMVKNLKVISVCQTKINIMNCRVADLLNGYTHVTVNIAISGKSNLCINQAMHRTLFCHCHQVVKCFKILPKNLLYTSNNMESAILPLFLKCWNLFINNLDTLNYVSKNFLAWWKLSKTAKATSVYPKQQTKHYFAIAY